MDGNGMKLETAQRICEIYDEIESADPDISTERLLAMTADRAQIENVFPDCDNGDVCDALEQTGQLT